MSGSAAHGKAGIGGNYSDFQKKTEIEPRIFIRR
jgi:hypothetical protein